MRACVRVCGLRTQGVNGAPAVDAIFTNVLSLQFCVDDVLLFFFYVAARFPPSLLARLKIAW